MATKMILTKIQVVRGHNPSDLGMVVATALFKLINMRSVVRSRPSLPGTTSGLIEKPYKSYVKSYVKSYIKRYMKSKIKS